MTTTGDPTVFVIDDDDFVRAAVQGLLKSVGLRAETFGTTQEFLSSKRSDGPSCLVLDVRLPGVNGLEFQRQLADSGVRIPIIFITGHGDIPMSVKAMKSGAVEFLTKPFQDEDLLNAIHQGLDRDRLASKYQYTFHMKAVAPTKSSKGGEVRIVDSTCFPTSKHIAAALVTIRPGGLRELHWHPTSSEWQFYIAGKGRMTVFYPVNNARTMDFNANDVGYVPSNAPHYIENTGDTDLILLETLAAAEFSDVSLNQWLRRVPSEMLKAHLNIDKEMALKIPAEKLVVI
jgi:FixJ family two-component response regulator